MATTARFPAWAENTDNTGRKINHDYQAPTYAAALTITTKPQCNRTLVNITATGALTLNFGVGSATVGPYVGDIIDLIVLGSGGARTVTWGTGILPVSATLITVSGKSVTASFMFDGTGWIELHRSIQA